MEFGQLGVAELGTSKSSADVADQVVHSVLLWSRGFEQVDVHQPLERGLGLVKRSSQKIGRGPKRKQVAVEEGQHTIAESPLRFAPHTVFDLTDDVWDRVYTRAQGCFPPTSRRHDKYWPPVNRIDNAYGDRNLFCSCPPTAEYCEPVLQ